MSSTSERPKPKSQIFWVPQTLLTGGFYPPRMGILVDLRIHSRLTGQI